VSYGFPALLANIRVIPEVIYKIIFPVNISVLPTFSSVKSYLGLIFLVTILILPFVIKRIDKKKFYFGIFWFFLFLLPGLLVVYANQSQSFDYLDTRDYIPTMGLILSAAALIPETKIKIFNIRFISVGLIILFYFSVLTFIQSNLYRNPVNFAENAVQSNPERPFFYQKLADYYFAKKDYNKAAEYLKQAIQREPGAFIYYKNLALAYLHLKQPMNAMPMLEKAFELNNKDRDVINSLIRVNYELHDYKECLFYVNKAIEMGGKVDQGFYKSLQDSVNQQKN
jgi:tetratricopeptide (TPR) repeat protein